MHWRLCAFHPSPSGFDKGDSDNPSLQHKEVQVYQRTHAMPLVPQSCGYSQDAEAFGSGLASWSFGFIVPTFILDNSLGTSMFWIAWLLTSTLACSCNARAVLRSFVGGSPAHCNVEIDTDRIQMRLNPEYCEVAVWTAKAQASLRRVCVRYTQDRGTPGSAGTMDSGMEDSNSLSSGNIC